MEKPNLDGTAGAPVPNADASLLWTFVLVGALSAAAFAAVWFITTALIAAPQ